MNGAYSKHSGLGSLPQDPMVWLLHPPSPWLALWPLQQTHCPFFRRPHTSLFRTTPKVFLTNRSADRCPEVPEQQQLASHRQNIRAALVSSAFSLLGSLLPSIFLSSSSSTTQLKYSQQLLEDGHTAQSIPAAMSWEGSSESIHGVQKVPPGAVGGVGLCLPTYSEAVTGWGLLTGDMGRDVAF